jgi:Aminopeptidase P, N-terminal domain
MKRANRRLRFLRVVLSVVAGFCSHHATLSAQPAADMSSLRDDLKARRGRLMEKLSNGTMAILWSAPERVYSRDIDYEYRQDSDLLYLTGIEQPDTILVLLPGSQRRKEILFIRPSNPRREHYVGRFLSAEDARSRTGIENIFLTTEFGTTTITIAFSVRSRRAQLALRFVSRRRPQWLNR